MFAAAKLPSMNDVQGVPASAGRHIAYRLLTSSRVISIVFCFFFVVLVWRCLDVHRRAQISRMLCVVMPSECAGVCLLYAPHMISLLVITIMSASTPHSQNFSLTPLYTQHVKNRKRRAQSSIEQIFLRIYSQITVYLRVLEC